MMIRLLTGSSARFLCIVLVVLLAGLLFSLSTTEWNLIGPPIIYYHTPKPARDVVVVDNYAYITVGEQRLQVVDVSNPAAPVERGFYDAPESFTDVEVVGGYAYIAAGASGLRVIDVSNPATLAEVGVYHAPEPVKGVAVA